MQLKIEVPFTVRLPPWMCIVYNQYSFYCLAPSVYCLWSIVDVPLSTLQTWIHLVRRPHSSLGRFKEHSIVQIRRHPIEGWCEEEY